MKTFFLGSRLLLRWYDPGIVNLVMKIFLIRLGNFQNSQGPWIADIILSLLYTVRVSLELSVLLQHRGKSFLTNLASIFSCLFLRVATSIINFTFSGSNPFCNTETNLSVFGVLYQCVKNQDSFKSLLLSHAPIKLLTLPESRASSVLAVTCKLGA